MWDPNPDSGHSRAKDCGRDHPGDGEAYPQAGYGAAVGRISCREGEAMSGEKEYRDMRNEARVNVPRFLIPVSNEPDGCTKQPGGWLDIWRMPEGKNEGVKMTEVSKKWIREQARFKGIFDGSSSDRGDKINIKNGKFEKTVRLSSTPLYDECKEYLNQAYVAGLDGTQVEKFEEELAGYMGIKYAVALNSGEVALHFALKLAAERLYGTSTGVYTPNGIGGGSLAGRKVFCSDLTTANMANPIVFEGGDPVFIDSAETHWCMDPEVLKLAFKKYPDVKIVVLSEPYGFPGDVLEIRKICFEHDALLIECAGDSFGAQYWVGQNEPDSEGGVWGEAGALGDYCVLDLGKGKVIGSTNGGALLTRDAYSADKAAYWASGAKASTPWFQHEESGYSCGLGEFDAALLRGELVHMGEVIDKKREIYDRYYEKLDGSMAYIIPVAEGTKPNYWMTCMTCESNIQFMETRNDRRYTYESIHGTAAPMEIYDALQAFNVECQPVYKPMSMQPIYRNCEHFTLDGPWRMYESFRNDTFWLRCDRSRQYYESGLALPSDIQMSVEEQDRIIDVITACYDRADLDRRG